MNKVKPRTYVHVGLHLPKMSAIILVAGSLVDDGQIVGEHRTLKYELYFPGVLLKLNHTARRKESLR